MVDTGIMSDRLTELIDRNWDRQGIQERLQQLAREGIRRKAIDPDQLIADRPRILERVQRRAEEYEFMSHSCAKGSALAIMEEFGVGTMEIIRGLSPFPGLGMTGSVCGAVTGSLVGLGLYFGSDDILDYEGTGHTMEPARKFLPRFEREVGSIQCPKIQEEVIFGRYMDPRGSSENFEAFKRAHGYERCALLPGIGARIAADIIIKSLQNADRGGV
jgi:C_GCAxxG_C_C family probable redox protein